MRCGTSLATMALGLALSFGTAIADGLDSGSAVREVGTIRFIDRAAPSSTRRTPECSPTSRRVLVDFVADDRNELNRITAVTPGNRGDAPEASPYGQ
jgi:hypothetical protein